MAEQKKSNKTLLFVLLGCGGLLLVLLVTCVAAPFAIAYFGKKKLADEIAKENPALGQAIAKGGITGGITAGAGQMVASGAAMYGSMMLATTLPKEEQKPYADVMARLAKVGPQLTTEDIDAITKAMDTVQKAHEQDKSQPTADEARAFLEEIRPIAEKYEPK